jgi:hypothetical protein
MVVFHGTSINASTKLIDFPTLHHFNVQYREEEIK